MKVKNCSTCINCITELLADECLEENEEGKYLYLCYTPGDRMAEYRRLEKDGTINQVIGGTGEHEVNAKWDIETAYKTLSDVCEQVGGMVSREGDCLYLSKDEGLFKITFNPCVWHIEK